MSYGYINKFTAQPGKRDELMDILLQAAKVLKTTDDCIQYLVSTTIESDVIYVNEIWKSNRAHDASLEQAVVKDTISRAVPFIASVSNIAEQQIKGGKGLS